MASIIENEMRNCVIDKLRAFRPESRIIHELNTAGTGSPRADLACVGVSEILLFEIKSEKDVLKRLAKQWEAFSACSHQTYLVLDKKFFTINNKINRVRPFIVEPEEFKSLKGYGTHKNLWYYPEPKKTDFSLDHTWKIVPRGFGQDIFPTPNLRPMLQLLWREELLEVCRVTSLPFIARDNMMKLVERMILGLTGRQIVEQVCRMLRKRKFAVADEPIIE